MKTAAAAFMLKDVRSIPAAQREKILAALPTSKTDPVSWTLTHTLIRWIAGDKKAGTRRNIIAAATCNALIVCKGDRFAAAAIRAFRHRGRTCYYWTGSKLLEERISPIKPFNPEPSADANVIHSEYVADEIGGQFVDTTQVFSAVVTVHSQPIIEAEIWNERTAEKTAAIAAAVEAKDATMHRLQYVASALAAKAYAYTQTRPLVCWQSKNAFPAMARWTKEYNAIRLEHMRAMMTLDAFRKEEKNRERRTRLLWAKKIESSEDVAALSWNDITHPSHNQTRISLFDMETLRSRTARKPAAE